MKVEVLVAVTPWTVAPSGSSVSKFPEQESWRGSHSLLQGIFSDPEVQTRSSAALQADYRLSHQGKSDNEIL